MSPQHNGNNSWALWNGVCLRIVGRFYLRTACWKLPKRCAILPTYTLHIYIWLLKKQGEVTNLAFNKQRTFCIPCKEKVNRSEFFLFSAIKNSMTLSHRNILKCFFSWKQYEKFLPLWIPLKKNQQQTPKNQKNPTTNQSCLIYFQPGECDGCQSFCRNSVRVKEFRYRTVYLRRQTVRIQNQAYFAHTLAMSQ